MNVADSPPTAGNKRKLMREQKETVTKLKDNKDAVITDGTPGNDIAISDDARNITTPDPVRVVSRKSMRLSRDLQLANVIDIRLWINGVSYQYGTMCTFCTVNKATVNCPECVDFFCDGCDFRNHDVKKRSSHQSKQCVLPAIFCAMRRSSSTLLSHLKLPKKNP